MNIVFTEQSWEDYLFWQQNDRKILSRLNDLIKECKRDPFSDKGKPEPLKHKYKGFWSRRITDEHRLIYRVLHDEIQIVKCRFHYD